MRDSESGSELPISPLLAQMRKQLGRRWPVVAVLASEFRLEWPQANELIRGVEAFARMNTAYLAHGPWHFTASLPRLKLHQFSPITHLIPRRK